MKSIINSKKIARKTTILMAIRISLVVIAVSIVSYVHLTQKLEKGLREQLALFTSQRTQYENQWVNYIERRFSQLRAEYIARYQKLKGTQTPQLFDRYFKMNDDGTAYPRAEYYSGIIGNMGAYHEGFSGGIDKTYPLTDDRKMRLCLAMDMLLQHGTGICQMMIEEKKTLTPCIDFYIETPEKDLLVYWPGTPWYPDYKGGYDIATQGDFAKMFNQNIPYSEREHCWTGTYRDDVPKIWMVSYTMPIDLDGKSIAGLGVDITLTDINKRLVMDKFSGATSFIIRTDGRLIAHPELENEMIAKKGEYDVTKDGDKAMKDLYSLIVSNPDEIVLDDEANERFVAVGKIPGPGWLLVTSYPKSLMNTDAAGTVLYIAILGALSLLIEVTMLWLVLRQQIAKPLGAFVEATHAIAKQDFTSVSALLPINRHDEIGVLANSFLEMNQSIVHEISERKKFEDTLIEKNKELAEAEADTRAINEEIHAVNEELRATSDALVESEEKHRSLIEKMNVGLGTIDTNGLLVFVNPKFCEMLEYKEEELIGKKIFDLVEDTSKITIELERRKHNIAQPYELTWQTKSGNLLVTEILPTVLYDFNNNITGSQAIITDITEKKKTQQELEQYRNHLEEKVLQRTSEIEKLNKQLLATNEEIKATNEELYNQQQNLQDTVVQLQQTQNQLLQSEKMAALGVLIAGIAHEINNPVNFINTGLAGFQRNYKNIENLLAQYRALPVSNQEIASIKDFETKNKIDFQVELMQKMLKNIEIGVQRTTEIVKSLRAFAHNNENIFDIADIHESIDNTLVILHHQYKERIEIVKKYKPLPKIPCYPAQINQVFMNIITNAIQAIHDKGNITISTFKHDNYVGISISDTGSGISDENIKKIFDPFFTTKEVGKGTGLGLSITYKIVKEHNGNIEVKNNPNDGATFTVYLPINPA